MLIVPFWIPQVTRTSPFGWKTSIGRYFAPLWTILTLNPLDLFTDTKGQKKNKKKMKEIRLCWLGVKWLSQSTSTTKYSKILRQTKRKELITQSQYRMKRRENEAWFMVVNQMTANTHYNRDLFPNSTDVFLMVMLLTDTYIQSLWR